LRVIVVPRWDVPTSRLRMDDFTTHILRKSTYFQDTASDVACTTRG